MQYHDLALRILSVQDPPEELAEDDETETRLQEQ